MACLNDSRRPARSTTAGLLCGLALLLGACGGGGGANEVPPPTVGARLDSTFGDGGAFELSRADFSSVQAQGDSVIVDETGRLLVAGWTAPLTAVGPEKAVFVRVLATGILDTTFASGGTFLDPLGDNRPHEGRWAFAATAGRIALVMNSPQACIGVPQPPPPCATLPSQVDAMRLLPNGARDADYGTVAFGPMIEFGSLAEPGGAVVILGGFAGTSGTGIALRRLLSTAGFDAAFAENADAALHCPEISERFFHTATMARLASGKFLVARKNTANSPGEAIRTCIMRLNADGTLDASFGTAGRTYLDGDAQSGANFVAVLERPDGGAALVLNQAVSGGERFGTIAWLTTGGAIDTSRGSGGITRPIALGAITSAAMQTDGKIVLSGWPFDPQSGLSQPFGYDRPRLLRLGAAGTPDASFGPAGDGVLPLVAAGRLLHPSHVTIARDGTIYVAGFTGSANVRAGSGEATRLAVAKVVDAR